MLDTDRASIVNAKKQRNLEIAAVRRSLKSAARSQRLTLHTMKTAQHELVAARKNGDTSTADSDAASYSSLHAQAQQIEQTLQEDRVRLASTTQSTASTLAAALKKLAADSRSFKVFRRTAKSKS